MIRYDPRRFWKVLATRRGSIVQKCLPLSVCMGLMGAALSVTRKLGYTKRVFNSPTDKYIDDNFSGQMVCIMIGYLLIMRTTMAFERWMEGAEEMQTMHAKWITAFDQMMAFLSGQARTPEETAALHLFRARMGHWFVLMSCMVTAELRSGEKPPLDLVPILPRHPKAAQGTRMSVASCKDAGREKGPGVQFNEMLSFNEMWTKFKKKGVDTLNLSVLHEPTPEEVAALEATPDMIFAINNWILMSMAIEVRKGAIDCPPPILTMVYADLSAGMLAFHQALKISRVPFPFPFAQMVMVILVMLFTVSPFYIDVFTGVVGLTPAICFVVPICYYGLNMISVEIEAPFGTAANCVEMEERHELFATWVEDVLQQPLAPPKSVDFALEKDILAGEQMTRLDAQQQQDERIQLFKKRMSRSSSTLGGTLSSTSNDSFRSPSQGGNHTVSGESSPRRSGLHLFLGQLGSSDSAASSQAPSEPLDTYELLVQALEAPAAVQEAEVARTAECLAAQAARAAGSDLDVACERRPTTEAASSSAGPVGVSRPATPAVAGEAEAAREEFHAPRRLQLWTPELLAADEDTASEGTRVLSESPPVTGEKAAGASIIAAPVLSEELDQPSTFGGWLCCAGSDSSGTSHEVQAIVEPPS